MMKRLLVAFDFDHTIIDENSDIVVRDLIPEEKIPAEVRSLYRSDGWTAYMQRIFELLHANGVTRDQISSSVRGIPATPGLDRLLSRLRREDAEVIVVSDSNSQFIADWLEDHALTAAVDRVFTNPARYDDAGCLHIDMYHEQDWCPLSTKNLCKGHILESYVQERGRQGVTFARTAYVGDGKNDLCPCLRLSANDMAFPRRGYALMDAIAGIEEDQMKAKVYPWSTGSEILDVISDCI